MNLQTVLNISQAWPTLTIQVNVFFLIGVLIVFLVLRELFSRFTTRR